MKKLLVICVGNINLHTGTGIEDSDTTIVSTYQSLTSSIGKCLSQPGVGLETQELDVAGIGTGLSKVVFDDTVEVVETANIKEAAETIKNDTEEDRDRVVVLGNNLNMVRSEREAYDEVESSGAAIYDPENVPALAKDLVEYSSVAPEEGIDTFSNEELQELEEMGVGLEGFFQDVFRRISTRAKNRQVALSKLESDLNAIDGTPNKTHRFPSLNQLHVGGDGSVKGIIKGIDNQLKGTSFFHGDMRNRFVEGYKRFCKGYIKWLNQKIGGKIFDNFASQYGKLDPVDKDLLRFIDEEAKKMQEAMSSEFQDNGRPSQICGGKVYGSKFNNNTRGIRNHQGILIIMDPQETVSIDKDPNQLSTDVVKIPTPAELKDLHSKLVELAKASEIEDKDISVPVKELKDLYQEVADTSRDAGFKIPLLNKLFRAGERGTAAYQGKQVGDFMKPLAVTVTGHNFKTIDAGIEFISAAIKQYD